MFYKTLLVGVKDQVATITLNRPDTYNALNLELAGDLFRTALEADEDREIRCIVITGAGKVVNRVVADSEFSQALAVLAREPAPTFQGR